MIIFISTLFIEEKPVVDWTNYDPAQVLQGEKWYIFI